MGRRDALDEAANSLVEYVKPLSLLINQSDLAE